MKNPYGWLGKSLIGWYGLLQAVHLIVLIRAAAIFLSTGVVPFPALPPAAGWSPQAVHFLVGNAIIDLFNIVIAFIFIYGYFTNSSWHSCLGVLNLTATLFSSAIFAYGTLMNGAWAAHPAEYITMAALFLPVIVLFFLFRFWAVNNSFSRATWWEAD